MSGVMSPVAWVRDGWRRSKSPRPLRLLFLISFFSMWGIFAAALVAAWLDQRAGLERPSLLYGYLSCAAFISVPATISIGMSETICGGWLYSGFARRVVTREDDPVHFWVAVALIYVVSAAFIALGAWRMSTIDEELRQPQADSTIR
jgi:hypothetical protein